MIEQEIHILQKSFEETVGFRAHAEVSEKTAGNAAGIIIELEEKLITHRTYPIDLFMATIATSQLLQRCDQQQKKVLEGIITSIEDSKALDMVNEKLSLGNLSQDELKHLLKVQYIANPKLGANKAMDIFERLHTLYGGFQDETG